jgi:hypothetical protein
VEHRQREANHGHGKHRAKGQGLHGWLLPLVLGGIGIVGGPAGMSLAQSPEASAKIQPAEKAAGGRVSLQPWRQGGPRLWVSYPWKLHSHASLELYLATGQDTKRPELRPMFFLRTFMPGQMTSLVHECLDHSEDAEDHRSHKAKGIDFQIIGRRNSLERPSVLVVRRVEGHTSTPDVAAVLPILPCWALSERLLCVDLPADSFAEAGLLRVWLLRGDQILWSEAMDWPGKKE